MWGLGDRKLWPGSEIISPGAGMVGSAKLRFMRTWDRRRPELGEWTDREKELLRDERREGSSRWRPALRVAAAWRDVLRGDGDGGPSNPWDVLCGSSARDDMLAVMCDVRMSGAVVEAGGGERELRSGAMFAGSSGPRYLGKGK